MKQNYINEWQKYEWMMRKGKKRHKNKHTNKQKVRKYNTDSKKQRLRRRTSNAKKIFVLVSERKNGW